MNNKKLKNLGGDNYLKRLLDKIRNIRSNEKVFYRQVLDSFTTMQNKMHYAIHGKTISEKFININKDKRFMCLITSKEKLSKTNDAKIAKIIYPKKELKGLNALGYSCLNFNKKQAKKSL